MYVSKEANSSNRGKSSAYVLFTNVEDEEGEPVLLASGKLISSPSILLTANQEYGGKGKRKTSDWLNSLF